MAVSSEAIGATKCLRRNTARKSWKIDQPHDAKLEAARPRQLALLENYSEKDVSNLMVFLENSK